MGSQNVVVIDFLDSGVVGKESDTSIMYILSTRAYSQYKLKFSHLTAVRSFSDIRDIKGERILEWKNNCS